MRAWNRNVLSIAKLICIKFNLAVAMLAEANNQMRLQSGRLFVGLIVLGRAAVRIASVQVDEDVARFAAIARTDDAAILQFIHDACGAPITEAQAALEDGDAGLLLAADDFDAILGQWRKRSMVPG